MFIIKKKKKKKKKKIGLYMFIIKKKKNIKYILKLLDNNLIFNN